MNSCEERLAASGLPAMWAARHPALRRPETLARATAHVCGSLRAQPRPARLAVRWALGCVPLVFRLATGRSPGHADAAHLRRGADRMGRLPGLALLLRAAESLALYGGLDGEGDRAAAPRAAAGARP